MNGAYAQTDPTACCDPFEMGCGQSRLAATALRTPTVEVSGAGTIANVTQRPYGTGGERREAKREQRNRQTVRQPVDKGLGGAGAPRCSGGARSVGPSQEASRT